MQSILLKSAKVIDAESKYNGKNQDILIVNGLITEISNSIESNDSKIIDIKGLHVSKGWFDSSICFGEPGYEERETIENGGNTASLSGFTDILLNPNTNPVSDCKSDILFVKSNSDKLTINIHPVGAFTIGSESK